MPKYVQGVELTQDGIRAIFQRMGQDITSGIIYNGNPDIRVDRLDAQGFMPILTGVSPTQESGHWIMLIKGQGNQYYLFDPLGETSGRSYQEILTRQLPQGATLSVIPNTAGLNMGLCGYWVASAGLRAHAALTGGNPPSLVNLGQTITQEMRDELAGNGYAEITGWLRAVAHEFPAGVVQTDATALRRATEKDLHIEIPTPLSIGKGTTPKEIPTTPTASGKATMPLDSTLLASDADVRSVIDYVHKEYLGKSYPGPLRNPKDPAEGRLPPNEGPERGTHGLAHTVRTMACAEVMVEEARKAQFRGEKLGTAKDGRTLADVTPEELKKILIAQAFFVVGRDDERSGYDEDLMRNFYEEYHQASEQAFRKYVEDNKLIGKIFKDQKEVDFYAAIVKDRSKNWDGTPAHVLIHKGHMVDLMRVKAPQEIVVESGYNSLKGSLGSHGAETVLKTHREFFLATGAVVPLFNPEARNDPSRGGPYENPYSGEKYAIEEGKDLKSKKDIRVVNSKNPKKDNERFVTIQEYYALPEVQQAFPGCKAYLEPSSYMLPTSFARTCEQNPAACLGAIQQARSKVTMDALKGAFQSAPKKDRRQANVDEIAAARIIQQIMANPDSIHEDHVLLNDQRLEEQFFRDLLAKCDMAIVGSLLNDTDIANIDGFMQHERNTEFHSTDSKALPVPLGKKWDEEIRQKNTGDKNQIKHDLVYLMQNDAWYFSRVNAIAQHRDKGSTFKEVLITALMTPLTRKSLEDTHGKAPSPRTLFRGLEFPNEFKSKLINQANTMIANTTGQFFTDPSVEAFKQIKLNDYSHISARTNVSTSTNIDVPRIIFDSNTLFEMLDPDGLLQPKQVGRHEAGSEQEFSVYLPDDVALIPIKVTLDGQTSTGKDRHIFTFVAIKSPDFVPRHESGYAVEPFLKMQSAKLNEATNVVEQQLQDRFDLDRTFILQTGMSDQVELPITDESIIGMISRRIWTETRQTIPRAYKTFLENNINPLMERCIDALLTNNMENLGEVLTEFPTENQWSSFTTVEAELTKTQLDEIKQSIEKLVLLQAQVLPALNQCKDAVDKQDVGGALKALNSLPSDKDVNRVTSISSDVREQINRVKQELTESLGALQRAVITPAITNPDKVGVRCETLFNNATQQITDLEKAALSNVDSIKKAISNVNILNEELKLLRNENEKVRIDTGSRKVDSADIEKLEERLRILNTTLYDTYVAEVTKQISALEKDKPTKLPELQTMISGFNDRLAEVEQLRQEKAKKQGTSTSPLDMSDIDGLKGRLQTVNQYLVKVMMANIRISLNQMDAKHFHDQEKAIQQNLQQLDELANTLDGSDPATKQKEKIKEIKLVLVAKQQAYPEMVQLQFRNEALIIQLRELCEAYQGTLAKERSAKTQQITNARWRLFQGFTDYVGFTKDERVTITNKAKELDEFKDDLNNDTYDVQQLIDLLANKSPAELEEAIGIPKKSAENLHRLVTTLNSNTTDRAEIGIRLKAIDDILVEISKKPKQTELTKAIKEEPRNTLEMF